MSDLTSRKMAVREQMRLCRQDMVFRSPFTAGVLMRLDMVPVSDVRLSTASTDGRRVFVDIDFFGKLSDSERVFVLAHEVWHCILLHLIRGRGYERERFNCACDMEVNYMLLLEGLSVPHGALMPDPSWGRMSAESIYDFVKVAKSRADTGGARDLSGQWDEHLGPEGLPCTGKGVDPDYLPLVVDSSLREVESAVAGAGLLLERMRGALPAHIRGVLGELGKGMVDWRHVLARYVTLTLGGTRRWLPPSRRFVHKGLYLQSARQERIRAVVAVDTSGSVIGDLPCFFGELRSLLFSFGSYEITVVQCDDHVRSVTAIADGDAFDPEMIKYEGGGGTDFRPVFQYVDEHSELAPQVLIYVTDGYGAAPICSPGYPVLWVLTKNGEKPTDWGETAFLVN